MSATLPPRWEAESSRMKLLFHCAGGSNGNAFPVSSSSSSCADLSSPESPRSQSCLAIGQIESPDDCEIVELTLTTAMRENNQMTGDMISEWVTQDESMTGKIQFNEFSESLENSVSIYLEANQYCTESWNSFDSSNRTDIHDFASTTSSSIPGTDATESPAAGDEDDEEALFLSISSDVVLGTGMDLMNQLALGSTEGWLSIDEAVPDLRSEEPTELCISEGQRERIQAPSNTTYLKFSNFASFEFSQPVRASTSLGRTTSPNATESTVFEQEKVSKFDLKNGKAKVESTHSPTQAISPNKRTTPIGMRARSRKDRMMTSDQTKTHLSQPTGGKNSKVKNSRTTPMDAFARPKRRSDTVSGKLAVVTGQEFCLDSAAQTELTEKHGANEELKHPEGATVGESRENPQKVSSKLGPGSRNYGRSLKAERESSLFPSAPKGPPGHGSAGPKQNRPDVCTSVKEENASTPARKPSASLGVPKPSPSSLAVIDLTAAKPSANQHTAALRSDSQLPHTLLSKLPVKGLASGSELTSVTVKGSGGAPTGLKINERWSKSSLPGSSPSGNTSSTSTSVRSDTAKPPAMRNRTQSLQARTMTSGLKSPSVNNHNVIKQSSVHPAKVSSSTTPKSLPLQRSGSARLSRLNNTVDKNKSRDIKGRSTTSNALVPPAAGGNHQSPVLDQVVTDVATPATNSDNRARCLRQKAKTSLRSSPERGLCLQNISNLGTPSLTDQNIMAKPTWSKAEAEKKNQAVSQLKRLLVQGNKRVEALATVIQHLFTEHEEALKQKKELSLQLINLREELVASSRCCERLHKEKEEVQVSLEETLRRLQEQHKEELVQLENRLRDFYQAEWDKVHETYQEEADKCRAIMEKQVDILRSQHIDEIQSQMEAHSQRTEGLQQQHKTSLQELNVIHQKELENLHKSHMETEASLSEQLAELSAERKSLLERLREEEEQKRMLADRNLKDSHTMYLEQELESLKVVLDMKNNQLHQKEKRLQEMDRLVETNVKLEECLKKVQQENEDYKARMDKHAALSKQLSSEQAKLQQTLQMESKVNKRLSMENEELLWKLHNGDLLASPRRLSPTSPFASPRNSASFPTTAPVSPR
ncbi:uncharacterized protein ACB058_014231 isoform 1-T1 [Synchiropus picturatus]